MYCQFCGKELPASASSCPACEKPIGSTPTGPMPDAASAASHPSAGDTVDAMVAETERAARDLAAVTARVSKALLAKADEVAKDPKGSAKKAARRAASELDRARKEIERALDELK